MLIRQRMIRQVGVSSLAANRETRLLEATGILSTSLLNEDTVAQLDYNILIHIAYWASDLVSLL